MYSELKLSEKLAGELNDIRQQVGGMREQLEDAVYEKDQAIEELAQVKVALEEKDSAILEQKKQLITMRESGRATMIKCEQMIKSSKALT